MARSTNKDDRRARLLRALAEVVAREGYAQASIAQAISLARVSRSTFYEHFEDKLDCFLALERDLAGGVLSSVEQAAQGKQPEEVVHTVLSTLVELAEEDPTGMRVLLTESLAAGSRAMDERDSLIGDIARLIDRAWTELSPDAPIVDVPARTLVGGTFRLLSLRILRGASGTHGLLPDLLGWADSYVRTAGAPQWRTLEPKSPPALSRSPHTELPPLAAPAPLPPGRHGLPAAYVSANQRERILQATIVAIRNKGYVATTVSDIVAEAHLTRAVFYQHFHNKQEVFNEVSQVYFQRTMAVSARAFFSAAEWPERLWEGIRAAAELNVDNPALTHLGFIETNAVGPEPTKRIYDLVMAFAVFVEEGYRQRPEAQELPRLCSEAISTALFELLYEETRREGDQQFRELIPYIAYIALAPFMGPEGAEAFIETKLNEPRTPVELGPLVADPDVGHPDVGDQSA